MTYVVQDIRLRKGLTDYNRKDPIEFTPEEIAQGLPEILLGQGSISEASEDEAGADEAEELTEEKQDKEAK